MDTVTQVQMLDEADCISGSTNALSLPYYLPIARGRMSTFALVDQSVQEEENSETKPV